MGKPSIMTVWRDFLKFHRSPAEHRHLVFYSEGPEYWLHFKSLIMEILSRDIVDISYVSSSLADPGLHVDSPRLHPYCIGLGAVRTLWFLTLEAKVVAMTMPDIDTFHIKRSSRYAVWYVYLFHAPVSTHMMYREAAFDHYDEIFCVGPYHEREIRRREEQVGLPAKTLFRHGCTRLDDLIAGTNGGEVKLNEPPWVMVASSWTDNGIIATVADELLRILLDAGFRVTLRTHPRTRLIHPEQINALRSSFGNNPRFELEDGSGESVALARSDIMICDWSGVAVEYAFVRGKPVISLETPRKINNPNYESLNMEPMEAAIRSEIGEVLSLDSLPKIPEVVSRLCAESPLDAEKRRALRDKWIFNVGGSDKAGADRLVELAMMKR